MRRGTLPCALLAAAILAIVGCSDGGSSGTGITTAQGNVVSTDSARREAPHRSVWLALRAWMPFGAAAFARTALGDIRVTVDGTSITTLTDDDGTFILQGRFFGPTALRFERAEDGVSALLPIAPPSGATLIVSNVRIAPSGEATAESQHVEFPAVVYDTDCERGRASVISVDPSEEQRYPVSLAGGKEACAALATGDEVEVAGESHPDGSVETASIEPRRPDATPGPDGVVGGQDGSAAEPSPTGLDGSGQPTSTPVVEATATPSPTMPIPATPNPP